MSIDGHINLTKDVVEFLGEETKDSHTSISIDGYDVTTDDMSTNHLLQDQSCENSTVEELTILEKSSKASTTATDLVNDKAT